MIIETDLAQTAQTVATSKPHVCDYRLGELLRDLLEDWSNLEPERCRSLRYTMFSDLRAFQIFSGGKVHDVALSEPWLPSEVELAIIDRSVFQAASDRGWQSTVVPQFFESDTTFLGRVKLGQFLVEGECCEPTIARLQSYQVASRGDY